MKSLIIGANGMVGSALGKIIPNAIKTVRLPDPVPTRFELYADITKYESLFSIFSEYRPEVVYLCAYNTDVDKCDAPETNHTNIKGPLTVLRLCEQFDSRLVFFSSSYVFDGESKFPYSSIDDPKPINNYGFQKLSVENYMIQSDANDHMIIIRTVGVFGYDVARKNFVNRIGDSVSLEKKVHVPDDQWMNPVLSTDLAQIAVRLVHSGGYGVFHVAGNKCVTKYDWAKKVASYFGYEKLVIPTSSEKMKQTAKRPKMGCLDCHDLEEDGITIPDFESGLNRFLDSEVAL